MEHPPANSVHEGVGRFEIFDFAPERLPALRETVTGDRRPFSIHSPLSRRRGRLEPAHAVFFLSPDPARRESSFVLVEETLAEAKEWGAEYVVAHMNWVDDSEDASEARRLAVGAARRLSQLSERYGVELHVECGGYSGAFHHPDQFGALAREFPALGLCLDIGHLWLIAESRGRSFFRDLETLAPHARSLHLWNAKDMAHYRRHHHVPLHPSQRPSDGWIDVERALAVVLERRPDCRLIFEYTWPSSEEEWVREGMSWVVSIAECHQKTSG